MANHITLNSVSPSEWLSMSNGMTNVFIDILLLLQSSENHANPMVLWIIEKHKNRIGDGFSGFDIGEMPWNKEAFEEERKAFISVIDQMKDPLKWNGLNYNPNANMILRSVKEFRNLVSKMTVKDIIDHPANNK